MTNTNQIYKCTVCGNITEVLHTGIGELVCCGQPMNLSEENTVDAATEKHVPVVSRIGESVTVKVGEGPHPMDEDHYIEWIELISDKGVYRQNLKPGDSPEAKFLTDEPEVHARAYCNLHGLWKSE